MLHVQVIQQVFCKYLCKYLWIPNFRAQHFSGNSQTTAESFLLVELQHQTSHFAAVTNRNVRHEFDAASNRCITVAGSKKPDTFLKYIKKFVKEICQLLTFTRSNSQSYNLQVVMALLEEIQAIVTVCAGT